MTVINTVVVSASRRAAVVVGLILLVPSGNSAADAARMHCGGRPDHGDFGAEQDGSCRRIHNPGLLQTQLKWLVHNSVSAQEVGDATVGNDAAAASACAGGTLAGDAVMALPFREQVAGHAESADPTDDWKQLAAAGMVRSVYLRTGRYRLMNPLVLGPAASGLNIVACPGARAVLEGSGGAALVLRGAHGVTVAGLIFTSLSAASDRPSAHLELDGAQLSHITDNVFVGGETAILLEHASGNVVDRNLVVSPQMTGIELRDGSDGNLVEDNTVDGPGAAETSGGGIFLHGVRDNRIAHNLVANTAGFGIGLCNWDAATINVGNIIEYNHLQDTARDATDSGAIYVLGRSNIDTETVIGGNVIDGFGMPGQHGVGIYLDDSTSGTAVVGNLVRGPGSDAVQIHGGSGNLVTGNILDLGDGRASAVLFQAAPADTHPANIQTGNMVTGNVVLSTSADPKLFVWLDGGSPSIAHNFYVGSPLLAPSADGPVADVRPVIGAPQLAHAAAADGYQAVQQAAAAAIGFRPIDPATAGPRHRSPRH